MTLNKGHIVKVELKADQLGTRIWIDGVEVQSVVNVEIRHHVAEVARVTLTFQPSALDVTGEAELLKNFQAFTQRTEERCLCGHSKLTHVQGTGRCVVGEYPSHCSCKRYEPDL